MVDNNQIWEWLKEVPDPEIPVINVAEMGIIREVSTQENEVFVKITPTYSGCPAMKVIEDDIRDKLIEKGLQNIRIESVLAPAWTTDWLTDGAREKLKAYGIAPPDEAADKYYLVHGTHKNIRCPRCESSNTKKVSEFGSTPCKALYQCKDCLEPFDYFKCI